MAALALNGSWHAARMFALAPQVLLVAAALAGLQLLLERGRSPPAVAGPAQPPTRPALLGRLPGRLAGAELYAIQAEDHYLRFHTDKGSALLLMRLGDAIAGLDGLEGARTHRSWWVARDAVIGVSRGGGRAMLRLKDGLSAPVSRTYSPALRKAGWFQIS
jgi:DNA-binding LytR/AlgR family response regulator